MNTIAYDRREPGVEPSEEEPGGQLSRRPRRNLFNRRSAALLAILTCAAGFYAGVRVEKGQISSTPSTFTLPTSGSGASGASGAALRTTAGGGASRGGFAGAATRAGGAGGGSASFGTVSTVNGKTLVVTEASGNTVKVRLAPSAKITKSQSVSRSAIHPGDTVVIAGAPNSSGTVVAATVSDSGAGRAGGLGALGGLGSAGGAAGGGGSGASATGSGRSTSASGGSGSAVGSLFSGSGG